MDWDNEAHMRQLVSIDLDINPIPRWMMFCIQFPDASDFLSKKYGTKEDQKFFKKLRKDSRKIADIGGKYQ